MIAASDNPQRPPNPQRPNTKSTTTSSTMATKKVDLQDVIEDWAFKRFAKNASKKERKLIEQAQYSMEVDWKRVRFVHDPPVYEPEPPKPGTGQLSNQVLFNTTFTNKTDNPQSYTFKTERTTRSSCEVEFEEGFTQGYETSVKLSTPSAILEANAGFHKEISLTKSEGQCVEEELTWGVDSQIQVEGRHRAEAKLIILEEEYKGKFTLKTRIRGRARVIFYNLKDNNSLITVQEGDVDQIVKEARDRRLIEGDIMIVDGATRSVICKTSGNCTFKYGLKQDVEVDQMPIGS